MRHETRLVALVFFALINAANGGQFNRVLSIGDTAPQWSGLEGVDGKMHGSNDIASTKFVVVAFTCNSCPYALDVEERLIELSSKAAALGGALVAINVNTIDADAIAAMRERAKEKGFDFAYLYDPTQAIANAFGAKTTPEFYVLGPDRKIAYMGSLDDSPDGKAVTKRHVESAIAAVLQGKTPEVTETVPIGCRIRFAKVRGKN
jgi:peroxiredoxin